MTLQLGTSKKLAQEDLGPALSPKIVKHVAKKLQRRTHTVLEADNLLGLYVQGITPNLSELRRALRRLQLPAQVVAIELRAGASQASVDVFFTEEASDNLENFIDQAPYRLQQISLGMGRACVLVSSEDSVDSVCSYIKRIVRSGGYEANIGVGQEIHDSKQLPQAYKEAYETAVLGERLWDKPYTYKQSDIGVVAALSGDVVMRQQALMSAEAIVNAMAKPKNLLPTLKLFFANNMSPTEVARAGRVHRNTVIYRLEKIKSQTGLDPLDFSDATQLYLAISLVEAIALPALGCGLSDSAPVADRMTVGLFGGLFRLSDGRVRQAMSSVGRTLPSDFTCFIVQGKPSDAIRQAHAISIPLGGDQVFVISSITQARKVQQFAQSVSEDGARVAYVSSRNLAGYYGKTLAVLLRSLQFAKAKWPNKRVVADVEVVGLLSLIGSKSLYAYACDRARSTVAAISSTRQLDKTALALLDSSLNLTLAARRLKVHRNTLIYRVGRIKHLTGYDLTKFEDALQVRLAWLLDRNIDV